MDISAIVAAAVKKVQEDPSLLAALQEDPVKTLEKLTGQDLPDDQVKSVVSAVQSKLGAAGASAVMGQLFK